MPHPLGSHAPRPRKNVDTLHNEAWLRERYLTEQMTPREIGALLGVSAVSVRWALRKFDIPTRSLSEAKRGRPSTTRWTPEMRAQMTEKQREAWKTRDRVSKRRGANYHPDPKVSSVRKTRAYRRGLTGVEYDEMLAAQKGVCAICGESEWKKHRGGTTFTLAVDHDHTTGRIRSLLCNRCNVVIGFVKEDRELLTKIASYLERHAM